MKYRLQSMVTMNAMQLRYNQQNYFGMEMMAPGYLHGRARVLAQTILQLNNHWNKTQPKIAGEHVRS